MNKINNMFLLDRTGRYTALEGLRGLAVLMVFFVHAFAAYDTPVFLAGKNVMLRFIIRFLHSGQIGVDLFFVLSGFFIALNLRKGSPDYLDFVIKRFKRLLPAHIPIQLFLIVKYQIVDVPRIAANLFFVDIFFKNINIINYVTWSLGYEILFYLLYGAWNILLRNKRTMHSIHALLTVSAVIWTSQWWGPPLTAWISKDTLAMPGMYRFVGFLWGIGLAKLYLSEIWWPRLKKLFCLSMIPSLLLAAVLQWFWEWGRMHKPFYFLAVDLVFFMIIAGILAESSLTSKVFSWKPIRVIGVISYSFYLSHPVAISVTQAFAARTGGVAGMALHTAAAFALTLVLSVAMFMLLEKPYFTKQLPKSKALEQSL